ncbi:T9SS type A sorting domain-containing protein [Tamlana sp. 2_MG-2023]|uniref:T9SS type A sorting domain-containing protein n=1 Tax=unclassified Tamlana TaxID=2614803 RepID=UPI0026E2FB28|nr:MULTISPECIES: T9SS type A sorting domain-containing protein [unclassified Tamlana]MDO6760297.1 T9SS type A sorting domain-containing protein [Tamlana sp. 2_MG-2023]MDO6790005.1 T9SS type A sorting domain-containing protein [Tamlana sp. 1_MG-2023]
MRKITLLLALMLSISTFAQGTIEVLSYPEKFAAGNAIFGPAVGEDPIVIRCTKIAFSDVDCPSPIRDTSEMVTALSGLTIPATGNLTDIDATNSKQNIGGANRGFSIIHQMAAQDATFPDYIRDYVDHGDGTMSFVLVHTRWSEGGGQAFVNGNLYTLIQRIFNRTDGTSSSAITVKDDGTGTTVVAGMEYDDSATIESDATLISRANNILNTLGAKSFNKETVSFYPNPVQDQIHFSKDIQTKSYKLMSITGAVVKEVDASSSVLDVSELSPGVYIVSTDAGFAKFIKL